MREPDYSILSKLTQPTSKNVKRVSVAGQRFHRLTVYGLMGFIKTRQRISYWLCRCDCGNWSIVARPKFQRGYTKSCGCYINEIRGVKQRTHRMTGTRIWRIWVGVTSRCYDTNCESYPGYGGRGITIADRWRGYEGFSNFFKDMGHPPSDDYSLDRIDNDGPYSPENCKWSDKYEQARNTRRNRFLTANNQTYCIAQWSEITGLKQGLIAARLRRGWSDEEALAFKKRYRLRGSSWFPVN